MGDVREHDIDRRFNRPNTLACSRAAYYCDVLRPNSPPCCATLQFSLLGDVAGALDDARIDYALARGTGLGALRTIPGLFLPWDRDADVYFTRPSLNATDAFDAAVRALGYSFRVMGKDYRSLASKAQLVRVGAEDVLMEAHARRYGWYNASAFRVYTHELDWRLSSEGTTRDWIEAARGIFVDLYALPVERAHRRVLISSHGIVREFPVQRCSSIEAYFKQHYKIEAIDLWQPRPVHIPNEQHVFMGYEPERRCVTFV